MKGQTVLIIGGIVISGMISYEIYKHFSKFTDKECKKKLRPKNNSLRSVVHNSSELESPGTHTSSCTKVYEAREAVVHSVRERHGKAAKAMEESLNTIFNDSEDGAVVTENDQALEETSNDLNNLLK